MQKLLNIAKVIDAINEWIGRFAYWIILLMIFIGVWNVVGRYVGRFLGYTLTSNALIEIQWYLFDIVFFLGAEGAFVDALTPVTPMSTETKASFTLGVEGSSAL